MDNNIYAIPVVALRGLVVFPEMVLHFDIARQKSIHAIQAAMDYGQEVFLLTQKSPEVENPEFGQLYKVGVVAHIRQVISVPDSDNIRVIVEGGERAKLEHGYDGSFLYADVKKLPQKGYAAKDEEYALALMRRVRDYFNEYADYSPKVAPDVMLRVVNDDSPGGIADYIASVIKLDYTEKQQILETQHPLRRLELVCEYLAREIDMLKLETEISRKVEKNVDDNQREYYLREQMRVLSEELDGGDGVDEIDEYRKKIQAIQNMEDKHREKLLKELSRLQKMGGSNSSEATVIRNYLDVVLDLPWDTASEDNLDIERARKVLERDHYGLEDVKDRVIELLAVRRLAPDISGQIICLAGPPGVGKTSIAISLAEALGRKYERISLGGVRDEAEIRGHRKTYIGAMPGRVMAAMTDAGTNNPLILFDEIDKMGADVRGDPASAMLEVLDGEQNKAFVDHFVEVPFDLSKVLFLTTANNKSNIPAPLLDRMEVIDLYSYTAEEKFHIAKKHLVPKALKRHGITRAQLKITDAALRHIISDYTREAGVRILERKIHEICRKTALEIVKDPDFKVSVKVGDLQEFLGVPHFKDSKELADEVGVTNGLAWTSVGGEMLKVEAAVMDGGGKLELTGSLGDVMKESARAAVSYIRTNADKLKIDEEFYKNKDIHIHVPEGAVPKDGPSAGVTIATSLLSALSGEKVDGHVAMTGEISLTGRVMPIGGLKEKTMAAYKAGIRTVIIPKDNVPDLQDVDNVVKDNIEFIPVTSLNQVWNRALRKDGSAL
ncbi:MAG: endopeptidase La [Clostridia bacterium]|nr:endopeptidase La [Clostridia bacterium]